VADYRHIISALARRDQVRTLVDGLTAANDLGLTTAVPAGHAVQVFINGPFLRKFSAVMSDVMSSTRIATTRYRAESDPGRCWMLPRPATTR
jgi:hypothetical protein